MKVGLLFLSAVGLLFASLATAWDLDGRCYTFICQRTSAPRKNGGSAWTSNMCDCLGGFCRRRLGERIMKQKSQSIWYDNSKYNTNNGDAKNQVVNVNEDHDEMAMEVYTGHEEDESFNRELQSTSSSQLGSKPSGGGYKLKMWWHEWSCWQYETRERYWCAYPIKDSDGRIQTFIEACGENESSFGWNFKKVLITDAPSVLPSASPSVSPTMSPSVSMVPSALPSSAPTSSPSAFPTSSPSTSPSNSPSLSFSPTSSTMPSSSPSISFETIAMAKFLDTKEEKTERTIYLLVAAAVLLVLSILLFVIGKRKTKGVALFAVALVIMLTPATLETRPTPEDSTPGEEERRELESAFAPYHVYQIKNVRMNMCMRAKKKQLTEKQDDPHRFTILVEKCDKEDAEQLFTIDAGPTVWDDIWGKWNDPCKGTLETCFELHPFLDPESCFNNPHHPKSGEKLMSENCRIPRARGHQTNRWELANYRD
eukprot:scaffold702079_cov55-Attheya_sp.AAC.1